MKNLLHELRRRNVIKAAISYVVIGWAILQVAGLLFPAFDIPATTIKYILYALAIGFPLWIVFAYIYEWTPDGFKKTEEVEVEASVHQQTGKRLNKLSTLGLTLAVVLLLADRVFNITGPQMADPDLAKSIAVLPFENMSNDDQTWFAKGVTEDILTHISKIGDLRVLSNFTLRDYDVTNKTVEEIGKELGVGFLLTGSIRRSGEQLRITCQLVQVNPEEQTWAENYDKRMDDIFVIQSQVAEQVALRLKAQLTSNEEEIINIQPTRNLEAYDLYLKGHSYLYNENKEDNAKAIDLFQQAIALDKDFIDPYLRLITAYNKSITQFGTRPSSFFDTLFVMSEKLVEMAPNNGDAWETLAYQYLVKGNYEKGIELSRKGLALNPNSTKSLNTLGLLLRNAGKLDEAIPLFEKAKLIEPLYSFIYDYNLGMSYMFLDMYKESERNIYASMETGRSKEINYSLLGYLYTQMDLKDSVQRCIENLLEITQDANIYNRVIDLGFYAQLDETTTKSFVTQIIEEEDFNNIDHYASVMALSYFLKKDNLLDSMNRVLDRYETEIVDYFSEDTSGELPALLVEVEMFRDNHEKALEHFEEVANAGNIGAYTFLKKNFILEPLKSDPRYSELANKLDQEIQRQRMNLSGGRIVSY